MSFSLVAFKFQRYSQIFPSFFQRFFTFVVRVASQTLLVSVELSSLFSGTCLATASSVTVALAWRCQFCGPLVHAYGANLAFSIVTLAKVGPYVLYFAFPVFSVFTLPGAAPGKPYVLILPIAI